MKLTELFFGNKQVSDTGKVQTTTAQDSGYFGRQLQSLTPGQTIQGEVLSRNGDEVRIKVSEDMVLKAKVDENINLETGKNITFIVKNNGKTLTLAPLYTNTATDANVLKALDMAALPANSDTIYMTEAMMHAGLSIDKNSLLQVYREITSFPGSDISDIVDLHRMSMPVNEENLTQISSYKNMTHQLEGGLNQVSEALPNVVNDMLQNGEVEGAAKLYQEIINLISEADGMTAGDGLNGGAVGGLAGEGAQNAPLADTNVTASAVTDPNAAIKLSPTPEGNINPETIIIQDAGAQTDNIQPENAHLSDPQISGDFKLLLDMLAEAKASSAEAGGRQNPEAEAVTAGNRSVGQNDINGLLGKLLQQGIDTKDTALLQNLLGNKDIAAYINGNLQKMWSISPQEVAEKDKVSALYRRLGKQLQMLTQALENVGQAGSEAHRATTNLTQNLDFLQQMNEVYTYLQLPIRLQQGNNAHGDLYVYTNKKHLASKEGQITALLHLDMENLGPVDVYVAMQDERVSTKFYVQDEVLDFLSEHMHILTERLNKRGYQCTCEMLTRDEEGEAEKENVIRKLLEKEPQVPLVQYSFDVRT